MTCFRVGIAASRIAEVLNKRMEIEEKVACLMFMENGKQTTVSGEGFLFDNFKKTGKIEQYSGLGCTPKRIYDRDFDESKLRTVTFSETYYKMSYDGRDSKYFFTIYK